MKPVTEYQDYRVYMQDYYNERKRVSSFSWREFTRASGFTSPTYLKLVCEGKTRLSPLGADKVGSAMHLAGFELEYFKAMGFDRSFPPGTPPEVDIEALKEDLHVEE